MSLKIDISENVPFSTLCRIKTIKNSFYYNKLIKILLFIIILILSLNKLNLQRPPYEMRLLSVAGDKLPITSRNHLLSGLPQWLKLFFFVEITTRKIL